MDGDEITFPKLPPRGVEFTFVEGPEDGKVVACERLTVPGSNSNFTEAGAIWIQTSGGKVGEYRFAHSSGWMAKLPSAISRDEHGNVIISGLSPPQPHFYRVTTNVSKDDRAYVTLVYRSEEEAREELLS